MLINEECLELNIEPIKERFYNEENGYGIYLCKNLTDADEVQDKENDIKDEWRFIDGKPNQNSDIIITGNMQRLYMGKRYNIKATEVSHPKYGKQYQISYIDSPVLTDEEGEQQFIKLLVSDIQFSNIISVYPKPVSAIMQDEFDYKKVKGYGSHSYLGLQSKVKENYPYIKGLSFFGKYGIKINIIKKIVNAYTSIDLAIEKVTENPYILYTDIEGIGFKKADAIAQALGMEHDSPFRICAGIIYSLECMEQLGNTWGYINEVKIKTEELLGLEIEDMESYLSDDLFYIDKESNKIAYIKTWRCENDITRELYRIDGHVSNINFGEDIENQIRNIESKLNISYTDEQKQLFYEINKHNVIALTGWAGVGKTFVLNGCLKMIEAQTDNIVLLAPTAKAANTLERTVGKQAATIHRGLGYTPLGFKFNAEQPLEADIIVVDEVSMCDIWLFRSLLQAIPSGCKLILVGDPAQLESVAVGNVLHDIINSECFATVKLQTVFRQALKSGILSVATSARQGLKFYDSKSETLEIGEIKNCHVWFGSKDDTTKRILTLYQACLKKWSIDDIMVIVPMNKGISGVNQLNVLLQRLANPQSEIKNELTFNNKLFRENDKVIHIKNDYNAIWLDKDYVETSEAGVFNGDTGKIIQIDVFNKFAYVDYDTKIIKYSTSNLEQLQLAYCVTCHKFQGSQCPIVIMGVDISAYMNLKKSLIYTAITRASQQLYIVAEKKALSMALKNDALLIKKTFLNELLIQSKGSVDK